MVLKVTFVPSYLRSNFVRRYERRYEGTVVILYLHSYLRSNFVRRLALVNLIFFTRLRVFIYDIISNIPYGPGAG